MTEPLKSKLCLDDPKNFRYVSAAGAVRDPNCEVIIIMRIVLFSLKLGHLKLADM